MYFPRLQTNAGAVVEDRDPDLPPETHPRGLRPHATGCPHLHHTLLYPGYQRQHCHSAHRTGIYNNNNVY